jgi:hypothetical protein
MAGAGFSAAQAQGSYAGGGAFAPGVNYDATYVAYDYGWGPGPIGVILAAPFVAAAALVAAPFAAAATLAAAPLATGYYADPYYEVGYYGAGYYGPTYVAYRNGPYVRRAAIVTRGPYGAARVVTPVRGVHARPTHMRQIHRKPTHMQRVQAQPAKVALARAN